MAGKSSFMADITFECPECKQHLVIDAASTGFQVQCPACSLSVTVPQSIIKAPAEIAPVLVKPISRKLAVTLKLIVFGVIAALSIFGITTAVDFYHRSQSTILFNAGTDEYAKGNYVVALADLNKVIRYRPDFADAYNVRGLVKYSINDFDGALGDFNLVIQLRPDFPEVYCNRGNVEFCKADMTAAYADYSKAIEVNPADYVAHVNRGNIDNNKGDYDGALGDYDKAIQIKPDYADAINRRDRLKAAHQEATPEPSLTTITAIFQQKLNGDLAVKDEQGFTHNVFAPQFLFDCIHPIGTGKSITVTDVVLNKDEAGKIQSVGLRLVLNWQGPVQSGSTIFQMSYNNSNDTFETDNLNIISTDGITRQGMNNFANGVIIGAQIGEQIHDAFNGN